MTSGKTLTLPITGVDTNFLNKGGKGNVLTVTLKTNQGDVVFELDATNCVSRGEAYYTARYNITELDGKLKNIFSAIDGGEATNIETIIHESKSDIVNGVEQNVDKYTISTEIFKGENEIVIFLHGQKADRAFKATRNVLHNEAERLSKIIGD